MTFVDPAGVNDPVLMASAVVMVVLGSCCRDRLAHVSAAGACANAAPWTAIRIALADPTIADRVLIFRMRGPSSRSAQTNDYAVMPFVQQSRLAWRSCHRRGECP